MAVLQLGIDGEVLMNERKAAGESVCGLLGSESLQAAMSHAVVLSEVTIDSLEAVVGFAGDEVRVLAFGVTLPADDAFVCETGADVVQRGAARDEVAGLSFVLGEEAGHATVTDTEQLRQVTVGKEASLGMCLQAQAERLMEQTLWGGNAVDTALHIVDGAEIEENGNQVCVGNPLAMPRRGIATDGHPQDGAMRDMLSGTQVLLHDFQDHLGAEAAEAGADAWELDGDPVGQGIFQVFFP